MTNPMTRLGYGLPPALRHGCALVAIGVAGYTAWSFSGPYRWLAEAQLRIFGGYYPFLTLAVLVLTLVVPMLGTLQLARKLGVIPTVGGTVEQYAQDVREQNARSMNRPTTLAGILGVALLLVAFRMSLEGIAELEIVIQVLAGCGLVAILVSLALAVRQARQRRRPGR